MPRIITKKTTVFQFDELSEEAKKRAIEWYRESNYEFWDASCTIDNVISPAAEILGISFDDRPAKLMNGSTRYEPAIFYSIGHCQGDGASFEGAYRYAKGALKAIKKEFPEDKELHRIAKSLQDIQKNHFYGLRVSVSTSGRYSHEYSMHCSVENAHNEWQNLDSVENEILETLRDFARWIFTQLWDDLESQNEEDSVIDSIRANEYEFLESGARA